MTNSGYKSKSFRMSMHLDIAQDLYNEYHNLDDAVARRYFATRKANKYGISAKTIRSVINAEGPYKFLKGDIVKKNTNRVPKKLLIEMLRLLGLTMKREIFMERRMWKVSDGSYHGSLLAVYTTYKSPKDKKMYEKIHPLVVKIEEAIR